ncbi:MAG: preprotein translocase subunit SecG [Bacteroidetes bacterium]|nr:preprotein translocase subunit SecG [Bacteroidota bacterium]
MTILFIILIVVASLALTLFVLIQNPKGGGLAGNIAGFSNQYMGVKQTTDVLEKGTWVFAGLIGLLCIIAVIFIPKPVNSASGSTNKAEGLPAPVQKTTAPAPGANPGNVPMPSTTPPATTPTTPK